MTSPRHPNNYPSNLNCQWEVRTSAGPIVINILDFKTKSGYDFVKIDGPGLELGDLAAHSRNMLQLSGTTCITKVTSRLPAINITMTSGPIFKDKGFDMRIVAFITGRHIVLQCYFGKVSHFYTVTLG